jgi:copper chaperone CopZ
VLPASSLGRGWLARLGTLILLVACAERGGSSASFALVSIQVGGETPDLPRVEATLRSLPGVLEVAIDERDRRVDVAYDPSKTARAGLLHAIQALGYEAETVFRRTAPADSSAPPAQPPPETPDAAKG